MPVNQPSLLPRAVLLLLCGSLLLPWPARAQNEDWLPVSTQDLRFNQVPADPDAAAVQLYYADYIDDQEQTEFVYRRIKVLSDKGIHYANVEITVPEDASLRELRARTIHPDGKILDFHGRPFQKLIFRDRSVTVIAKSFTLPKVTVGSIIEYKYKLELPGVFVDNSWTIQHELYTVKERFRMKPFGGRLEGFTWGHKVAALATHMPENLVPKQKGDAYELEVDNMPPFEREGFMPPEDDYKPQIRFFYGGQEMAGADRFWQDAGRRWNDEIERFIGRHREIAEEASRVIGSETAPLERLRRLYARAQAVRNLTFERERTEQEVKRENLRPNQNVLDVLLHGYGDREAIGRFFVALARAAGFEASILRVSDRREGFFDHGLMSRRQLGSEIVLVHEHDRDWFLDPGTIFAPFGFVRWMHTSAAALKVDRDGGAFLKVPAAGYEEAMVRREANLDLDGGGTLRGVLTVTFVGGEALERRIDFLNSDAAGRTLALEREARGWLPGGAAAHFLKAEGWERSEAPLVVLFAIEVPRYATAAGKRLILPACLFQPRPVDAFASPVRRYPVYFPHAFAEQDAMTVRVPEGYVLESAPAPQTGSLAYANYLIESEFSGRRLDTRRSLQLNGIFFPTESYNDLRGFLRSVHAGDEGRVVLHLRTQ